MRPITKTSQPTLITLLWIILFTLLLFCLSATFIAYNTSIHLFKYVDDIINVTLSSSILILLHLKRIDQDILLFSILLLLFALITIAISIYHNNSTHSLIIGFLYYFKPFIIFLSAVAIIHTNTFNINVYKITFAFLTILAGIFIFTAMIDLFIPNLWSKFVKRHYYNGFPRIVSFMPHTGQASWLSSYLLLFFISISIFYPRKIKLYSVSACLILLTILYLTYIKKSILGVIVATTFGLLIIPKRNNRKITLITLTIFPIIILIFSQHFYRFYTEYSVLLANIEADRSRLALFVGAWKIANESIMHLLFGAGLGMWGGYASSIIYSPYYYKYNFSEWKGFSPNDPSYTGDNYFAHILGEVGVIGFILTFILFFLIFKMLKKRTYYILNSQKTSIQSKALALFSYMVFIELLIESLGFCAPQINTFSLFSIFLPILIIYGLSKHYLHENSDGSRTRHPAQTT